MIPYFDNMPDSTYDSKFKDIELKKIDEVSDDKFEEMIKEFPDSYKPYLRYLHSIHDNWTFTPLNAKYDFYDGVTVENNVSSIEVSSGHCASPMQITEKNWCIATREAVAFFMDPRNFLNETYIFMFENLGFKEVDESLIKGVLSGTFMDNIEPISNKSYSLLFLEAGRYAKVSALYLASLSRQEAGAKLSNTTNGAEFTYEGYTYSGLYNFYNIGASSGESNPALAGLVFANGGKGKNNGGTVTPVDPIPDHGKTEETKIDFINLLNLSKNGDYYGGYEPGTKVSTITSKASGNSKITVKKADGEEVLGDSLLGTGMKIECINGNQNEVYEYVLMGDTNGDGLINSADLLKVRQHLLETNKLTGSYLKAASMAGGVNVNSADLLKLRQYLINQG